MVAQVVVDLRQQIGLVTEYDTLLADLKMFLDLSPPGIVREHLDDLLGREGRTRGGEGTSNEPYIDVPYRVLDDDEAEA